MDLCTQVCIVIVECAANLGVVLTFNTEVVLVCWAVEACESMSCTSLGGCDFCVYDLTGGSESRIKS